MKILRSLADDANYFELAVNCGIIFSNNNIVVN